MPPLRIVFMGTPELAASSLKALLASPVFQVVAVVTQPDRPKGRELKLQPSPVKQVAQAANLPILQPERVRNEPFLDELKAAAPDLIAVAAFGQILPKALLELPKFGCLNVHTSLLPKYRGAAPIQWALLNDEHETGVTLMKMDVGLDTGDILAQHKTLIQSDDTSETLHARLAAMGAELLVVTIPEYVSGKVTPRPQPQDGISFAPKIKKEDGRIDWAQPARAVWSRVRALVPWPGAFTAMGAKPALLKLWRAEPAEGAGAPGELLQADHDHLVVACAQGALRLLEVQREGGKRLGAREFLAGHHVKRGDRFGP